MNLYLMASVPPNRLVTAASSTAGQFAPQAPAQVLQSGELGNERGDNTEPPSLLASVS